MIIFAENIGQYSLRILKTDLLINWCQYSNRF